MKKGLRSLQSLAVLSLDSAVRVSLRGCSGLFSRQNESGRGLAARARAAGGVPTARGRRSAIAVQDAGREQGRAGAGSEAMHSDTRARKQATSTVPLYPSVQPCHEPCAVPAGAEPAQLKPQREGKSTSRSQSTVRHVYKSNYEIKDVRAA